MADQSDHTLASFNGTLAYGRLALIFVFVACLLAGSKAGVILSIVAAGAAYVSQMLYTIDAHRHGQWANVVSIAAAVAAVLCYLGA